MKVEELIALCEGREFVQLVSKTGKRPFPYVQAELLCASPSNGQSVWLYKTKSILRALRNSGLIPVPDKREPDVHIWRQKNIEEAR